jgi:formylglycine-generating enzyme required for sulfatase activity
MKLAKIALVVLALAFGVADSNAAYNTLITVSAGTFGAGTNFKGQAAPSVKLGTTEVNWTEFQTIRSNTSFDIGSVGYGNSSTAPVENINWYTAVKWCNAASLANSLTPVYYTDTLAITQLTSNGGTATATVPTGHKLSTGSYVNVSGATPVGYNLVRPVTVTSSTQFTYQTVVSGTATATSATAKVIYSTGEAIPSVDGSAAGYRLPTEKEWEWAAWGGVSSGTYTYSGSNTANTVAWTRDNQPNPGSGAQAVGGKTANELGFYDMSGNVAEWIFDDASPLYGRRVRGGNWTSDSSLSRTMNRGFRDPAKREKGFGFRVSTNP